MHHPKVVLVIMDGWGYSAIRRGNAILAAKTPNFNYLWGNYSHLLLNSFGENVGLPWGSIGSSEVGHSSIGSGRLVNQELTMIDQQVQNGDFFNNKTIISFVNKINQADKPIHLIGLVSDGGVHSHIEHLYALLKLLKKNNFKNNIFIHAITDGRDTSPDSAIQYLNDLRSHIKKIGVDAEIVTVVGRYFAMDRDNRWDRTRKAYLAFTQGIGVKSNDFKEAIKSYYAKKITDEFIEPNILEQGDNIFLKKLFKKNLATEKDEKNGRVRSGDGIIFFNTRPDRMRQIAEMFLFEKKEIGTKPVADAKILTLTTYNEFLPVQVAYPSEKIKDTLARILSDHGYSQGHFAETEKYAHVTYFFNGGNSTPNRGEEWFLVPSPQVATYDLKPEMSADKITDKVFEVLEKKNLDFVLINFANADMVGHTGVFDKIVLGVEAVDKQLKRLMNLLPETTLMITADHGNAESKIHPETGEVDKRHTVNPVPFILVNETYKKKSDPNESITASGILADIAPTILPFFGLRKTKDMNGVDLSNNLK